MQVTTHNNNPNIDIGGTSLVGRLNITYSQLVEIFGEPGEGSSDGKTDAEWDIQIEDNEGRLMVLTIYNWKNGRSYCGSHGQDVENIKEWNVGGRHINHFELLKEYINNNLK